MYWLYKVKGKIYLSEFLRVLRSRQKLKGDVKDYYHEKKVLKEKRRAYTCLIQALTDELLGVTRPL